MWDWAFIPQDQNFLRYRAKQLLSCLTGSSTPLVGSWRNHLHFLGQTTFVLYFQIKNVALDFNTTGSKILAVLSKTALV